MRTIVAILLPVVAALPSTGASANSNAWSQMSKIDLEAAYRLISENHPGAALKMGDVAFQRSLENGYAAALKEAESASTFSEYSRTLERFAASFNDTHITSEPIVEESTFWPGFLVEYRFGDWFVATSDRDGPQIGSRLISCDGRSVDDLADSRLGPITSDWVLSATKREVSPRLMVIGKSESKAFLKECTFQVANGGRFTRNLSWSYIGPEQYRSRLREMLGKRQWKHELAPFNGGWWVRLNTLLDDAAPLVVEVERKAELVRKSPFVVVDLRGNFGGASSYSDRIAEVIYGKSAVERAARKLSGNNDLPNVWRVSPGNLKTLEISIARFSKQLGAQSDEVKELEAQAEAMRAALKGGKPLSTVASASKTMSAAKRVRATLAGRPPNTILLTDHYCFSSCLLATQLFRTLGALQVGDETGANTHYFDVRAVDLPSGLATFSTMQSYSPSSPAQIGPFTPAVFFKGDMANDKAVEAFVSAVIVERHMNAR